MDFTRDELDTLHIRSTWLGCMLVACDLLGYFICLVAITRASSWLADAAFSVLAGAFVGRLFMLGHDGCHRSLTPDRQLNRWLGTIALLPSLHPFSLWDLGHNRIHHRFTNQRGLDYVWEPLDPAEYARLSRWRRARYRFFRTPVGHLAYYGAEIWWRKMFFPRPSEVGGYRRVYVWDLALVLAWTLAVPIGLIALRDAWSPIAGWRDVISPLVWGWVMPIATFNAAMSTVIYLHHTHPRVVWTRGEAPTADAQVTGAVHVVLPGFVERTLHHIMEHPAHHARPGIPLYRLSDGQAALEERHASVIVERWTLAFHLDTLRRCKLFDLEARTWVPYDHSAGASPST